jgi:hypothetical protein
LGKPVLCKESVVKRRGFIAILSFVLAAATTACSESKFSGGSNTNEDSAGSATPVVSPEPPPGTDTAVADECIDGDKVTFKYDAAIQKCIDEGKLYNFDGKVCTSMPPATFDCAFDKLLSALAALGLKSKMLEEARSNGAKLVGCGQSDDGKTIVAQWYNVPEAKTVDCETTFSGGGITTGCYKKYSSGSLPTLDTKEKQDQFVLDCMNGKE